MDTSQPIHHYKAKDTHDGAACRLRKVSIGRQRPLNALRLSDRWPRAPSAYRLRFTHLPLSCFESCTESLHPSLHHPLLWFYETQVSLTHEHRRLLGGYMFASLISCCPILSRVRSFTNSISPFLSLFVLRQTRLIAAYLPLYSTRSVAVAKPHKYRVPVISGCNKSPPECTPKTPAGKWTCPSLNGLRSLLLSASV